MSTDQKEDKTRIDREVAEWLDQRFTIPGTNIRFGIDPVLGLIPGAGDWLAGVISLYFLIQAAMLGGRASVLGRMFINILLDVLTDNYRKPIVGLGRCCSVCRAHSCSIMANRLGDC